jgi:hypothetical protein
MAATPDARPRCPHVTGIDAQRPLPGVIIELQFTVMLEHPLTAAIDTQLAFLQANLPAQLVITLRAVKPRQRYLSHVANTPISVQRLAQLAWHVS